MVLRVGSKEGCPKFTVCFGAINLINNLKQTGHDRESLGEKKNYEHELGKKVKY